MRGIFLALIIPLLLLESCAPNLGPSSRKISGYVIHGLPGGVKGRSNPLPICPFQEAQILNRNSQLLDKISSEQWKDALGLFSKGFNSRDSLKETAFKIFEKVTPLLKANQLSLKNLAQDNGPCPDSLDPLVSHSYVVSTYGTANQSMLLEIMQERDINDGVVRISGILYSEFSGMQRTMWLEAYKLDKIWFSKDLFPGSSRMAPQQFH